MRDLIDLPVELFDHILTLAFGIVPEYDWEHGVLDTLAIKPLSRLLLVNQKWHRALIARVYSRWTYNGARHTYAGLWKFLRTVSTNPDLAATVLTLNIGNWGVCPPVYLKKGLGSQDEKLQFLSDDIELVSKLTHHAGIAHLEPEILAGFKSNEKRDRRPLVALLLTCLPNVSTVYAHIPASDPFLRAVLTAGLDQQQRGSVSSPGLGGWKELYLLSEVPGFIEDASEPPDEDIQEPPLKLDDVWPVLFLENLRTVHLYNLDTDGAASLLQDHGEGLECHVQHFHLATKQTSTCTPADVTALLILPKALTSLSFCWSNDKSKSRDKTGGKKRTIWKISNSEVCTAIQKYQDTLEYLDIYHDMPGGSHHNRTSNHFDPLTRFTKVKYLSTLAEVLIGGYSEKSIAPFRLRDSLPPNLESVVLCIGLAGESIPDFPTQIQEVVSAQFFPRLKSLQLSDISEVNIYRLPDVTPSKYQMVEETCAANGIRFDIRCVCNSVVILPACPFPAGGRCVGLWRKTYNLRADGTMRRVKAKERAARKEAGLLESSESEPEHRECQTHITPFTDHRSAQSFMVFENSSSSLLPPLVQFAMYFTHPESHPDSPSNDLAALHDTIRAVMEEFHFRLDIYFLPGGSEADCIAHYQAEKATRGNSIIMLQEAEERMQQEDEEEEEENKKHRPAPTPLQLPGMIDVFESDGGARFGGLLCICPERSWRDGQQRVCCVRFEPQFESPKRVFTEWRALTENSPGDVEAGDSLDQWMWDYAYHFREEAQEVFDMATNRGWTSW